MKTSGSFILGGTTSTQIDLIYDEGKIDYILSSTLSVPTESAPVALVSENIEVFPTSIKKVKLRYYKVPEGLTTAGARTAALPKFGYTTATSGKEVYSASTSIDFELPEHYTSALVVEMAKLIGINIKDSDVFSYAASETQKVK